MRPVAVVVPHTHWDREWHQPFETFRMMLVRTIDRALELCARDPAYVHFMLDGQSIVLEDYLALRPERADQLRTLIAAGRLAVGPWYVLPDVFLVSGESLVRNLEIGMERARALGGTMTIGYLPDSFGHVAQMPQILAGFGMETAALWRGAPEETATCEWLWEALDGTRTYVQWLSGGYGNLANLPADRDAAAARFAAERTRLAALARSGVLVMMNGSDHLAPQPHLPALLADWRARHADLEVRHATLAEAIALARSRVDPDELPVVRGELRSSAHAHLLPGVLSARVPLKLANARCQTLLERWAEPLSALARREDAPAFLAHAWRTLLENHPHDSICGCSVDEVHREMSTRFERVAQVGERLVHEALAVLSGEDPEADLPRQHGLRLENPHPWPQRAALEAELVLDCDPGGEVTFTLTDEEGRAVPATVLAETRGVRVVNRSPDYPLNVPVARVKIGLVADLPPMGWRTLALARAASPVPPPPASSGAIETAEWSVRAVPGALAITDRATGETVVHALTDVADRGDEYNFDAIPGDVPVSTEGRPWDSVSTRTWGSGLELTVRGTLPLPLELAADRRARTGLVAVPLTITARLVPGVKRVDLTAELDNRARDHRLRAAFRLPGPIASTRADTAFGIVERPARAPHRPYPEPPVSAHPMVSHSSVEGRGVAAAGLHEYEAEGDTLSITLLRCVGWLSRDDLASRSGDAGPMLATPEAQCPGPLRVAYSWISGEPQLERRAAEAAVPARAFPLAHPVAPERTPRLELEDPAWQLSALRRIAPDTLELRIFSTSAHPTTGAIRFLPGFPAPASALACRLDGAPLTVLPLTHGALHLTLRPFEVTTLRLSVC